MKGDENLPALDDMDFRKKQSERVVLGIEKMGEFFEENKKVQKRTAYISMVLFGFMLLLILIGVSVGVYYKGFGGIVDSQAASREFHCHLDGELVDVVRTYTQAEKFKELYGEVCILETRLTTGEIQ